MLPLRVSPPNKWYAVAILVDPLADRIIAMKGQCASDLPVNTRQVSTVSST
jgi:hypothetical protein